MKESILKEINQYLWSDNIDNVTKRILDFTWYFAKSTPTYNSALALRERYNLKRSLGQSELEKEELDKFKSEAKDLFLNIQQISIQAPDTTTRELLKITGLKKKFSHRSKSFSFGPVSIDIDKGDIVGVVGENGNGKTTFLRILQEEISKDSGEIEYFYDLENISASDQYKRKNRTAFIPQRIEKWRGTLMENLTYYAAIHGYKGEENTEIVQYVIHRMGLSAFTGLSWRQISSGYKLRFELAKMLVWQPSILILDEPLANLDIQATQNLLNDLRFFANSAVQPIGILLTSQQLHEVEQIADKILFLRNGKPVFSGRLSDFEKTREEGILEFTLTSTPDNLAEKLLAFKGILSVNLSSKVNSLHFSKDNKTSDILKLLLDQGLELTYFRDITNSTIQLFKD